MIIVLGIVVTIIAVVFSLPTPYMIFKGLVREDIKREDITNISDDKLVNVMMDTWSCLVYVVVPILIAIAAFQIGVIYYFISIAYAIFWQIIWACIGMKKRLLKFVLPILIVILIFCICLPMRDFLA